jgi:hypothetical protein
VSCALAASAVTMVANTPTRLHRFPRLQRAFGGPQAAGAFGLAPEPVAGSALGPHQAIALYVTRPAQDPPVIDPGLAPDFGKHGLGRSTCVSDSRERSPIMPPRLGAVTHAARRRSSRFMGSDRGRRVTWGNSRWKLCARPGQFRVKINRTGGLLPHPDGTPERLKRRRLPAKRTSLSRRLCPPCGHADTTRGRPAPPPPPGR